MRVLILHSRYLSGVASGENRVVEDEARLLRDAGHDVAVHAPSPQDGGPLDRVRLGASAVWSSSSARSVERFVRGRGVDVVHVHNLFPLLSPAVLRAASDAGARVVVTLHNYRLLCLPATLLRDEAICESCVGHTPWRGVVHRCYRGSVSGSAALASSLALHRGLRTFDRVDRFLAVSGFVRRKHLEAGFPADRFAVKPNFTWAVDRREGAGKHYLYLGRLSGEKGVETILEAWGTAKPSSPLVVAGDGPDADRLRARAASGVRFLGAVPPAEVPALLRDARALLVPSRWYEAAPRSIIEAYAAGVPVLASAMGALPEAVEDGVSGLLVPPDEPRAWAEAIGSLDDETSLRLGAGAFAAWQDRYSPARGIEALEFAYRDAMTAAAGTGERKGRRAWVGRS